MAEKKKAPCLPAEAKRKTGQIFGKQPRPFASPEITLKGKARTKPGDFLTEDVLPEVMSSTWRCKRKVRKGTKGTLRPCHIELAFIGERIGSKHKVPPGAYLRLCTEWAGEAFLIPVKDHTDALTKSREICACHQSKSRKKCATAFKAKYREVPPMQARAEKKAAAAKKPECIRWSKDGKRCLRRAKKE
jgi:hypothetical protein